MLQVAKDLKLHGQLRRTSPAPGPFEDARSDHPGGQQPIVFRPAGGSHGRGRSRGLYPSDQVVRPHHAGSDTLRRLVGEGRVDGFVLQRTDDLSDQALENLVANDARFVLVTSRTPRRQGSVILDDVAGAKLATEHLISLGHTRIGLVGGIPSSDIARRREHGYAVALHEAGLRRRENLVRRIGYSPELAAVAIESLVGTTPVLLVSSLPTSTAPSGRSPLCAASG